MDETSGPGDGDGHLYQRQHLALASALTEEANTVLGRNLIGELVFCSRSGPPTQPWLEPDVNDRLAELAAEGRSAVVAAPIGFVSDHMEVVYDLDTEAAATAARVGLRFVRAATVGAILAFVADLVDAVAERAAEARGEAVPDFEGRMPSVCAAGCCPNLRAARPATAGRTEASDHRSEHRGARPVRALDRGARALASTSRRGVGRLIRDDRPHRVGVTATKSTDTDVVTVMDQRSEELLHRLIRSARPDDGVLGEEGVDVVGTSGLTWIVDPIDGTVNYLYDIPPTLSPSPSPVMPGRTAPATGRRGGRRPLSPGGAPRAPRWRSVVQTRANRDARHVQSGRSHDD